ncbi:MAG TPA: cytochrome P450 [Gemmataceae bacterium]|jgi:cytochrome P450
MTARTPAKLPPGPTGNFLFGSLRDFRANPLALLLQLCSEYGDVCRFRVATTEFYLINHPDLIAHVLVDKDKRYRKSWIDKQAIEPLAGQGLLTIEGDLWKRLRRLLQPLFSQQMLESYSQIVTDFTSEMLENWKSWVEKEETFDLGEQITTLALRVIAKAILGIDFANVDKELLESFEIAIDHANTVLDSVVPVPDWVPTPAHLRFRHAKKVLDTQVIQLIEQHRRDKLQGKDLLSLMMSVRDEETGQGLSDELLRDQTLTFFGAGHETTAQSLKWLFYMLSRHPAVEQKVQEEIRRVLGGRTPTFKDAAAMPYTKMVIHEVMRVWPPVWMMEREAAVEDELGGYVVPPGTQVAFSQWVMHRHPKYWENPEGFDPERFSSERSAGRAHGAYFPFGAGPRVCIGNTFSLMEMQMIVPTILQKYRLDVMPSPPVVPKPTFTLRPMYGVPVRAIPRSAMS